MEAKKMRYAAISFLLILVAYIFSLEIRRDNFTQRTGADGLEATYHVLWTAWALAQSTAENHYYLPTVTKVPELGNPFVWGSTVVSRGGSYVYTSFPPAGFLLPYALFSWRSQGLGFFTLSLLNSLIGLSSAVAMGALARAVTRSLLQGATARLQSEWVVFTTVSILYLFLRESLVSHGAVYWPHSVSQLTLIIGAFMAYKVFQGRDTILSNAILLLALFIYPALEWTGFIFAVGVSIALLINWRLIRRQPDQARSNGIRNLSLAIATLLLTALSGIALIAIFSIAIGLENLLEALASRATARTFDFGALFGLVPQYFVSFGALVPLALLAGIQVSRNKMMPPSEARPEHLLFLVVAFPMLENVVLMQHAYQFSFDRLKLAVPLLLVVVVFLVRLKDQNRNVYVWRRFPLFSIPISKYSPTTIFTIKDGERRWLPTVGWWLNSEKTTDRSA